LLAERGSKIVASQLAGEFNLPKDKNRKLVFIAGGIGITPFRSILKILLIKMKKGLLYFITLIKNLKIWYI